MKKLKLKPIEKRNISTLSSGTLIKTDFDH